MPAGHTSVYGYLKNPSMVDYPGRMAAVMVTSGCNFRCGFCHNAKLMGAPKPGLRWDQLDDACNRFKADWVTACTVSGGEPTIAPDIQEILRFLKDRGFTIKLDTNGSNPDVLSQVLPLVDYIAMDIKCAPESYGDLTGFDQTERIAESIRLILSGQVDYEFRTTLIESFHTAAQVEAIGQAVGGAKRFVVQPFLPREDLPSPSFASAKRTTPHALHEAAGILKNHVAEVDVRGAGKESNAQPGSDQQSRSGPV